VLDHLQLAHLLEAAHCPLNCAAILPTLLSQGVDARPAQASLVGSVGQGEQDEKFGAAGGAGLPHSRHDPNAHALLLHGFARIWASDESDIRSIVVGSRLVVT
jgi:hypothetical protein